ncbi:MAG: hypothetical protein N5P05_001052 [Chroococcopsis gigantea SAG 12.99]|jgi:uncharacterized lipoprotein YddW (UPF0748 family)|nr:family 10 glycosylhydrolase [Chlorogloea purpurea SAG 13.99]MDV2999446.1 hypothetical protein [Chroococcopsis gigantea SAG 12.99]
MQKVNWVYNYLADRLVLYSQRYGRRGWLVFLLLFTLIVALMLGTGANSKPDFKVTEIRGVWLTNVDSDVLFSKGKLRRSIDTLSNLHFNTLYPTVWNWGHTLYPSGVAESYFGVKIDPAEGLQNRDTLKEIIDRAHRDKMRVIPWFEFGFMLPSDAKLTRKYPRWLTQRQDKSTIWWEGKVHQRVWLNPIHPEVQGFITALVQEIVSKYDIDGIQFDDHFGYPVDFGYDDYTVKLYQNEHNGQSPPDDFNDKDWIQWRADKITAYMTDLFHAIKAKNSKVIVSLSPNPQKFSLESFLLDWDKWREIGLVEELIVQLYRNDMSAYDWELSQPELQKAKGHIPTAVGILSGLKGSPVPMQQIVTQVGKARDGGFGGVSFFFYESLWNFGTETPDYRQNAFKKLMKPV